MFETIIVFFFTGEIRKKLNTWIFSIRGRQVEVDLQFTLLRLACVFWLIGFQKRQQHVF